MFVTIFPYFSSKPTRFLHDVSLTNDKPLWYNLSKIGSDNMANKKVRHVRDLGSVYFDETTQQYVGQVENGRYSNGRVKFKRFYCKSQNDVIIKMKEFRQSHILSDVTEKKSLILASDYFEQYLTQIKQKKLKPASYDRQFRTYTDQIKPLIGGYYLTDLTADIIQEQLLDVLYNKKYSFSTINKVYVLTNECLKYATTKEVLKLNPCDKIPKPKKREFGVPKTIRFFNDNEIDRFIETALSKNKRGEYIYTNGLPLIILIYTGLRGGEMMALKWEDVDLKNNYIRVHRNIAAIRDVETNERKIIIQEGTKTKNGRIVHLTKSASKYLMLLKTSKMPIPKDYVVAVQGSRDCSGLRKAYILICQKAKIDNQQGLHTLRHTFASLMIRKGVDIKIISEMLGHSSVSFTYNTYIHLIEEEKAKAIQQIDL